MPERWESLGKELSVDKLNQVAEMLLEKASDQNVWLFYGEMGSGKTTLIKAIGEQLGVEDGMSSPTFSIINEYDIPGSRKIYHFDLYRIRNESELIEIGVEEYFDSGQLCLIEWPDKLGSLMPPDHFDVRITTTGPKNRTIEFTKTHGSEDQVGI